MRRRILLADKLAREHVLNRDGYHCVCCGKDGETAMRWTGSGLEWAHILSRGARHLRWEPDNAVTLCRGDHAYFTEHPREFRRFIAEKFGPDHWDGLKLRQAQAERRGDSVDVEAVIRGFRELTLTPAEMETYRSGAW
jgi:5-methylcytosine-specific restriction endonuclease McrA